MDLSLYLRNVRARAPLVQCITNFVTVNDCANVVLASGGSPFMSDSPQEAAETVRGMSALVCNLGAIRNTASMRLAGAAANRLGKPVALDPVAAGGTSFRRAELRTLLSEVRFTAIRGNASEIRAIEGMILAGGTGAAGTGVDVAAGDEVTESSYLAAGREAARLARALGSVIAISGALDVVTDGERTGVLRGGAATMTRVTGSGCMLTALLGAMNLAGERAETLRLQKGTGNATFRTDMIDAIFTMRAEDLSEVSYEKIK